MRNYLILLFFIFLFASQCRTIKEQYASIYLFIDVTDTIFRNPNTYLADIPQLIKKIGVDSVSGGFNGGEIKIFLLNDVSQTKSLTVKLNKGVSGLLGQNELDRKDEIKSFYRELNKGITDLFSKVEFQKESSKIYQNLCRELNTLRTSDGDNKIAIIYSDMLENSNLLSFYGTNTKIASYTDNIKNAYQELSKDCELPDLNNIDIHVVTVRTKGTDEKINLAERFWVKLFKLKNCKISFDAELNF